VCDVEPGELAAELALEHRARPRPGERVALDLVDRVEIRGRRRRDDHGWASRAWPSPSHPAAAGSPAGPPRATAGRCRRGQHRHRQRIAGQAELAPGARDLEHALVLGQLVALVSAMTAGIARSASHGTKSSSSTWAPRRMSIRSTTPARLVRSAR